MAYKAKVPHIRSASTWEKKWTNEMVHYALAKARLEYECCLVFNLLGCSNNSWFITRSKRETSALEKQVREQTECYAVKVFKNRVNV